MNKLSRILVAICSATLVFAGVAPASAAEDSSTQWYLAIGDSLAAGRLLAPAPNLTDGYAGPVLAKLQESAPKTHLRNLACYESETSTSMLQGNPNCSYDEGSQFAQALVFLKAHKDDTTHVTLTIGANDVTPCLAQQTQAQIAVCVGQRLQVLAANLSSMLGQIKAAAPGARVIVGNFYNPYVVHPTLGALSTVFQVALNTTITGVAAAHGASVADVASEFHSYDAQAPAYVCTHTYMCSNGNIHPRSSGYDLISQAFFARL